MNLIDSLKENNSIRIKQVANTWEEAVAECIKPLIEAGSVEKRNRQDENFSGCRSGNG